MARSFAPVDRSDIGLVKSGRPTPPHYRHSQSHIIHWDCSREPADNFTRVDKLGNYWQTWGAAVVEQDYETRHAKFSDDMVLKNRLRSQFPEEPDNWVLRWHVKDGRGRDCVWANRLQVGHHKDAATREHRSTLLIDDCRRQLQAWLMDQFWIVKLGAGFTDDELDFTPAGFLTRLCTTNVPTPSRGPGALTPTPSRGPRIPAGTPTPGQPGIPTGQSIPTGVGFGGRIPVGQTQPQDGQGPRVRGAGGKELGALALNLAKNAGFVTDGSRSVASLWHLFHLFPDDPRIELDPVSSANNEPRQTRGQRVPAGGGVQRICRPDRPRDLALRGDFNMVMGTDLVHLGIEDPPCKKRLSGDHLVIGRLFKHTPSPAPPAYEMETDPMSPQPVLPRMLQKGLAVWMCIPNPSTVVSHFVTSYFSTFISPFVKSCLTSYFSTFISPFVKSCISSIVWGADTYADDCPKYQYPPEDGGSMTSVFNPNDRSNWTETPDGHDRDAVEHQPQPDASGLQPEQPPSLILNPNTIG